MRGRCTYCNKEFTRNGMSRHLNACPKRKEAFGDSDFTDYYGGQYYYQLRIEAGGFWMHILVDQEATLEVLDDFLRGTWFGIEEPSSFTVEGCQFDSRYEADGDMQEDPEMYSMRYELVDLVEVESKFSYVYGAGGEAKISLEVIGVWVDPDVDVLLQVMARNLPSEDGAANAPYPALFEQSAVEFDAADLDIMEYELTDEVTPFDLFGSLDEVDEYDEDDDLAGMSPEEQLEYLEKKEIEHYLLELRAHEPIEVASLDTMLNRFSLGWLKNMCSGFGFEEAMEFEKPDMVSHLATRLPGQVIKQLVNLVPDQLDIIRKLYQNGGMVEDGELFGDQSDISTLLCSVNNLLLFPGMAMMQGEMKGVICLPEEMMSILDEQDFKALGKMTKRNQTWMNLTRGVLYYYGMAEIPLVLDEVQRLSGQRIEVKEFLDVFIVHEIWFHDVIYEVPYLIHSSVLDPEALEQEIEASRTMRNITYRKLNRKEVLTACKDQFDRTPAFDNMKRFLMHNYDADSDQAKFEVEEMLFLFDNQSEIADVYEEMSMHIELPDRELKEEFMELLRELYNHHRQWGLLGYSPMEQMHQSKLQSEKQPLNVYADTPPDQALPISNVTAYDFAKKKKIGRNDPCPCGSGKKYKKCCGR